MKGLQGPKGHPQNFRSSIQMHRSRPLPNTFTAILNALWMCAYADCKSESRVRALVYPDLGLPTQSPVKITTSNLRRGFVVDWAAPLRLSPEANP